MFCRDLISLNTIDCPVKDPIEMMVYHWLQTSENNKTWWIFIFLCRKPQHKTSAEFWFLVTGRSNEMYKTSENNPYKTRWHISYFHIPILTHTHWHGSRNNVYIVLSDSYITITINLINNESFELTWYICLKAVCILFSLFFCSGGLV